MDSKPEGKTDAQGNLTLADSESGDHYLHVDCVDGPEQEFFVSIKTGESSVIKPKPPAAAPDAIAIAQSRAVLRDLVRKAADARTAGHF